MTLHKLPRKRITARLSEARLNSMDISELIGLCKGVLADGTINLAEAEFILKWLKDRSEVLEIWPADELYSLLRRVLEDGILTDLETEELTDLLTEVTGEPISVMFY